MYLATIASSIEEGIIVGGGVGGNVSSIGVIFSTKLLSLSLIKSKDETGAADGSRLGVAKEERDQVRPLECAVVVVLILRYE